MGGRSPALTERSVAITRNTPREWRAGGREHPHAPVETRSLPPHTPPWEAAREGAAASATATTARRGDRASVRRRPDATPTPTRLYLFPATRWEGRRQPVTGAARPTAVATATVCSRGTTRVGIVTTHTRRGGGGHDTPAKAVTPTGRAAASLTGCGRRGVAVQPRAWSRPAAAIGWARRGPRTYAPGGDGVGGASSVGAPPPAPPFTGASTVATAVMGVCGCGGIGNGTGPW